VKLFEGYSIEYHLQTTPENPALYLSATKSIIPGNVILSRGVDERRYPKSVEHQQFVSMA
jgi:hypothetical protein